MSGLSYLLDTDWIIDHLCGVTSTTQKLLELAPHGLAISVISLAELYEGVHHSRDPLQSMASMRQFLAGVTVFTIEEQVCSRFGMERGRLRKRGHTVGDFDLLIACTAICQGLTVCTNNRRHFEMIEGVTLLSARQ